MFKRVWITVPATADRAAHAHAADFDPADTTDFTAGAYRLGYEEGFQAALANAVEHINKINGDRLGRTFQLS